jgi:hypothetical protein
MRLISNVRTHLNKISIFVNSITDKISGSYPISDVRMAIKFVLPAVGNIEI